MKKLYEIINKQNIRKNILFLPFQNKSMLPYYYNAADIGVWPGQDSITIVEAIATGLPVIIPFSYRNIHYIENGNGFHFTKGSWKELMICLDRFTYDEKLRKKMKLKSRELAEKKLGGNVITEQTIDYYKKAFL